MGETGTGRQAKTKDGLMNVCEHVASATKIRETENVRDAEIVLSFTGALGGCGGGCFLECRSSGDMISRFPGIKHSTRCCIHQRIRKRGR